MEYLQLNLWILLLWAALVTHDGAVKPYVGIALAYLSIVALINMRSINRYIIGGEERDRSD
jgi:hypothetical protein